MADEKIDKDLELNTEIKVKMIWMEQLNGDLRFELRYQMSSETQLCMLQASSNHFKMTLDMDKEKTNKKDRMKPNERQAFATAMDLCAKIAARIGQKVYDKQIELPDTRIKLLDQTGKNFIN